MAARMRVSIGESPAPVWGFASIERVPVEHNQGRFSSHIERFLVCRSSSSFGFELGRKTGTFRTFFECKPFDLIVEKLPSGAKEIGLTTQAAQAAMESRLRSARLYNGSEREYLYVRVNVVGAAFSVALHFNKWTIDPTTTEQSAATTWRHGFLGTHGDNSGYVLSAVAEAMDKFLVEYLRVNEEACGSN